MSTNEPDVPVADPDLSLAVTVLGRSVKEMSAQITALARSAKQSTVQQIILALAVVAVIVLGVTNIRAQHRTDTLVKRIDRSAVVSRAICEGRNKSADDLRTVLQGFTKLPRSPNTPPPDPKILAAYQQLVTQGTRHVDCARLK